MADIKKILQDSKDALDKAIAEKRRNEEVMRGLGPAVIETLKPVLDEIAHNAKISKDEILSAVANIKINVPKSEITVPAPQVTVNVPDIPAPKIPDIKIPEIKLPIIKVPKPEVTVNIPKTEFPKIEFPKFPKFPEFPKQKEYSWKDPLPVILTDAKGVPYTAGYFGGSGGGSKAISDLQQLAGLPIAVNSGETNNSTLRVVFPTDAVSSVVINSTLAALDVKQVSGSVDSINVLQLGGVAVATNMGDVDGGTQRVVLVRSSNATTTSVSIGADASTSIVPTNLSRKSIIMNHTSTSNLYVATGTASSTSSMPLVGYQTITFDDYTGPINAIAQEAAGTISLRYIEIS